MTNAAKKSKSADDGGKIRLSRTYAQGAYTIFEAIGPDSVNRANLRIWGPKTKKNDQIVEAIHHLMEVVVNAR